MGLVMGAGVIFLLAMMGMMGTMNTDQKKTVPTDHVGTYQLAAGNSFYVVLDTRTGKFVEMRGKISKPEVRLADFFPSSLNVHIDNIGVGGFKVVTY